MALFDPADAADWDALRIVVAALDVLLVEVAHLVERSGPRWRRAITSIQREVD